MEEPGRELLAGLNPVQKEAVQHRTGPLLLFAGAGSGKTRVLTHRIAYLITAENISPWQILAVTFTNKAAREMQERLDKLVGESIGKKLRVGTFHAVCSRLLREFGKNAGIREDFVIYDDNDQITLIKQSLKQLNFDDAKFTPRSILARISAAKEKMIPHEKWSENFSGFFEDICGMVYPLYQEKLKLNNALDFDDLLSETVRLLREDEGTRERLQNRFRYILVDEYQDVNFVQYQFLQILAEKHRNICVVGDDDQSIYGWRGADVNLILRFEQDYPEARVLKLEQNYRSTRTILEAAHSVVSNNQGRKEKRLWTENDVGLPLTKYEAADERQEAEWLVSGIHERVKAGGRRWSDFAVLYRTNAQSRVMEDMLRAWFIPHRIVGGVRFYERKEVKDIIAYLRVLSNPDDSISMRRIINTPARGIGASTMKILEDEMILSGRCLWNVLNDEAALSQLSVRTRSRLTEFKNMILGLQSEIETARIDDLMRRVLTSSGYLAALSEERSFEAQGRVENINELLQVAAEYQLGGETPTLQGFLEQSSLVSDLDSMDAGLDAVTLMTLHAAKGLEFPVVFLTGLEENVLPHARSLMSDSSLEEERRLCYVGITRAMEELHLSSARRRSGFMGIAYNPPSRFLAEIPENLFHITAGKTAESGRLWQEGVISPKERKIVENSSSFRVGQKARHPQFGVGVVLDVRGEGDDMMVDIVFPEYGPRKLMAAMAKLEKVS